MAQELVWARVPGGCAAVSRAKAIAKGYDVLDESPLDHNGDMRRPTRSNGRRAKKKTSVAAAAAEKKAAEVIASEPASTTENEETSR